MVHIFLTGEIQVGKSTVIDKTIHLLHRSVGGFKTYFGSDRELENRLLYMNSAALPNVYTEENAVVRFREGCSPTVLTEKFNCYGTELIRCAKKNADIIIMDECGNLEQQAGIFQQEIMDALDGDIPVLGVLKLTSKGWTERIRNHPNVTIVVVTKENRNELPCFIAKEWNGL